MYLGIEIGGTKLQVVVGDEAGSILRKERLSVTLAEGAEGIRGQLSNLLPALVHSFKPKALGIGFGGPVDRASGMICRSHQIEGWSEFPLGSWIQKLTGVAATIDNDANVAALGEAMHGAGVGANPVFYVTLGSGVGGGVVVDGKIYHGVKPGEVEIGHVRLDREGTIVESRCSGWAVDGRIRALKVNGVESVLCSRIGDAPGGEAREMPRALAEGDAAARAILKEVTDDLALGLSHVVHLLHPEVIIIGGGLSLIGEPLRAAVAAALPQFVMEVFHGTVGVKLAALGEDSVPVGALALARAVSGA